MKSWQAIAAAAASVALTIALTSTVGAQNKPQKVGSVLDIDGPKLMTNRHKEGSWFQAYPTMTTSLGEKMKSDASTTATLEFAIGGQAVISPGTEIEIVGQREIDIVGNKILVKSGRMWAKVDKQNSQLQIQTSGGTMGIEGTEFVVEVNGEDTTLSMLEGTIAVTGFDGQIERFQGGEIADFGKRRKLQRRALAKEIREALKAGDPAAARELLLKQRGFPAATRGAVRYALSRGRGAGPRIFRNAAMVCGPAGRLARKRGAAGPKRPRPLRNPKAPAQVLEPVTGLTAEGARPVFSWNPVPGADKYSVLLSDDEDGAQPIWSATTSSTTASYPAYAPSLSAGQTYHWMVLPLNPDGTGYTEDGADLCASSTYTAEGHKAETVPVDGLSVSSAAGPLKASWERVEQAKSYRVAISPNQNLDELVWAEATENTTYDFPAAARGLEAGTYFFQVEAYDEFGVEMGVSTATAFTTSGWTSHGSTQP